MSGARLKRQCVALVANFSPDDAMRAAAAIVQRTQAPRWARGLDAQQQTRVRKRVLAALLQQPRWPQPLFAAFLRGLDGGWITLPPAAPTAQLRSNYEYETTHDRKR